MLKIDQLTFKSTAEVVFTINESIKGKYDDAGHLQRFMESMAYQYMTDEHFFSTAGFCLTAYDCANGEREVVATVMTYTVSEYIKQHS